MSTQLGTCATQDTYDLPYVESVQPGTGVTVDNTDPRNPIVSATGGGSGFNYVDKNSNYSAAVDDYVLTDTTTAPFTVTLPNVPVNGATIIVADATAEWATHSITLAAGGSDTIVAAGTSAATFVCSTKGATLRLTYYASDNWWVLEFVTGSASGGGGSGTVTTVSVTDGTGITASVANPTTTPDITIGLSASGVTAGTYGNGTDACVVTVDSTGRITAISTDPISGGGGGADPVLQYLIMGLH